jgi:hypothetical protein
VAVLLHSDVLGKEGNPRDVIQVGMRDKDEFGLQLSLPAEDLGETSRVKQDSVAQQEPG